MIEAPILITTLRNRINTAQSRPINRRYNGDLDIWFFGLDDKAELDHNDLLHPHQVKPWIDEHLQYGPVAYTSGGFNLGFHHFQWLMNLKNSLPQYTRILLGVESQKYIEAKGRSEIFTQGERMCAAGGVLKQQGILGAVISLPEKSATIETDYHYDHLIQAMGLFRRPRVFHLYTQGDPHKKQKVDRMLIARDWCELPKIGRGDNMSTTRILLDD